MPPRASGVMRDWIARAKGFVSGRSAEQPADDRPGLTRDEDWHLGRREVLVQGAIDEDLANRVMAQMLFLQHRDARRPLTLLVDSPGGAVVAGLAIMDTMTFLQLPVHTRCLGEAHSLAALIVAHGERGGRVAVPDAELSVSLPWPATGASPEVEEELERVTQALVQLCAHATGKDPARVQADFAAELRFTAQEAVEYGLVDRIE